jgi:DNA-binding FrmR family transcriptional regulator
MVGDRAGGQTELVRRLHCAEGHLRGIVAMIEGGADCRSVVHQIGAVQGALREVNRLIVSHHLTVCLSELLANTDLDPATHEHYLAEVMSLYELFGGRIPVLSRRAANDHHHSGG